MKTYITTLMKTLTLASCLILGINQQANAQCNPERRAHLIVDWQMNAPLNTDFADKISGWGMNFEGLYDITPRLSAGAFVSFHTNHQYVGRQTLQLSPTESLTTDQQRSAFQLPFGAAVNYALCTHSQVCPYVGAKLGAMFARNTTYFGTRGLYDKAWGFYASPEVGLKIYPTKRKNWGFHLTATLTGDIEGQNNAGFRLGIIF